MKTEPAEAGKDGPPIMPGIFGAGNVGGFIIAPDLGRNDGADELAPDIPLGPPTLPRDGKAGEDAGVTAGV